MICKYFSPFCFVTLLTVSFDEIKFLILMKPYLFFILLFLLLLSRLSTTAKVKISPAFSSKSFIVLALTIKSLVHFALIFVHDMR